MPRNAHADDLIDFLNASPTPFHAVETAASRLLSLGATRLDEKESWSLRPGQTAFVTRNGSSLVALRLPKELHPRVSTVSLEVIGDRWIIEPLKGKKWPKGFFDGIRISDAAFRRPEQGGHRSFKL